jgi:phosphoribosyl-ATP pyrophosphohydrolase/phosphoribosyl-AMP cyclohydrolase
MSNWSTLKTDSHGLVPAIIQDAETKSVLMLGYLNEEALGLTVSSGFVHFFSRSRRKLWKKGGTSGNMLVVKSVDVDCDNDALLITATQTGPTCHTGELNCFAIDAPRFGFLDNLWGLIDDRSRRRPSGSYVVKLLDAGPDMTARKLVEEATEVLISAKNHVSGTDDDQRLTQELGDVLFHFLVTMRERNIEPGALMDELRRRYTQET